MKQTFLMLRGLSRQQAHWGVFPKLLSEGFLEKGIQVDCLFDDLPGFGERCHEPSPGRIDGIAELLSVRMKQIPGQVHLLGLSMGGMVALELARRYPEHCRSLVMINSGVKPVAKFYQRLQPSAYLAFLKAWCYPLKSASERQILQISSEKYPADEVLLDTWLYFRKAYPPSRLAVCKQMLAAARYQAPVEAPLNHVLLIASRKDKIASYQCSEQLAKYWGLNPLVHPEAGHDVPLDDPDWLVKKLVAWYREILSIH